MVPRYVGAFPLRRAADSASGGLGGGRVGVALCSLGIAENALVMEGWERERRARGVARGRRGSVGFMVGVWDEAGRKIARGGG